MKFKLLNKINIIVLILLICCFSNVNADIDDYVGWTWKSNTTNLRIQIFSSADAFNNKIAQNYN